LLSGSLPALAFPHQKIAHQNTVLLLHTGSPKAEAPIENVVEDTTSASPAVATEAAPAEQSAQTADLQEGLAAEANGTPNDDSEEPAAAQTDVMSKSARKKAAKAAAAAAAAEEAGQVPTAPSTDADADAAGAADSAAPATTSSEPAAADDVEPSSADSPAAPAPATPATTGSVSRTSSAAGAAAAPPKRASSSGASAAAADSSSPSPAAVAAPMERGSSAGGGGSGGLDELADAPKVKALREQLSQVRQHLEAPTRGVGRQVSSTTAALMLVPCPSAAGWRWLCSWV
jgi:hypothetical protein